MKNILELLESDIKTANEIEFKKEIPKKNANANSQANSAIGLSSQEAKRRLERYGENKLAAQKQKSALAIFAGQYKDIMTIILLVCTAVSLFMGEYIEALAIAIIVFINGILGFIQEYRTEKTLEALKNMASPIARVYRDGVIKSVLASELTVGDVVLLKAGDRIPADGIMLNGTQVACDEAMLTGESLPVKKSNKDNSLFMGCTMAKGHCDMEVTQIGMSTQMGNIAAMLQTIEEAPTPLQKKLASLSKYIAVGCIIVCVIVSVTGMLRGEPFFQMLITGVSLAVAAVPEGLPAIVTISLALSVSRMVKKNALVRRLHAVETLGCATVICSDKTGTITQNKMTVFNLYLDSKSQNADNISPAKYTPSMPTMLECITLCNNAVLGDSNAEDFGGHTELALLKFAQKHNITIKNISEKYQRISEQPFDSERKRMSVVVRDALNYKTVFCKGAFDILLSRCAFYKQDDKVLPLTESKKAEFIAKNAEMADNAMRVIAVAYKKITAVSPSEEEENLVFLGLIGMLDPPREGVKSAVVSCHKAGIKTIMITGDHKNTAIAIAKQVSIYHEGDLVLTGAELDNMSMDKLSELINNVTVFARVSPNHKLQIVRALKRNGHIVAMTGDGVNDAPAIKEADIGVSMGNSGSDVAKEASSVILLDDNFSTLVSAVDEGRSIYNNIRKFIRYLLSCNIGEVMTMFVGMLMGMPVILLPIQILLVNLVTDGFPALALGLEPSEENAMSRPPRKTNEGVFSNGLFSKIIFRGIFIGMSTLASFVVMFNLTNSLTVARSSALFALIFAQLIHVFECKSEEKSLLHIKWFNNKNLILAVLSSLVILLLVLYIPPLAIIFKTMPLSFEQLLIPIGFCLIAPIVNIFLSKK